MKTSLKASNCSGVCLALCAIASSLSPATIIAVPAARHRAAPVDINAPNFVLAFIARSEEHTSELQSLMRISYAVFCLKKKKTKQECNDIKIYKSTYINMQSYTHHICI